MPTTSPRARQVAGERPERRGSFRVLLAANVIVMIAAAGAAIALLVLALERGI